MNDKKRVLMSLSNGLIVVYNIHDFYVSKVIVNKNAIIDIIKIVEDKLLITGGIDNKIRVWNIETEKLIGKFEAHSYSTLHMAHHKEFIYSYGYDMRLCKFKHKSRTLENHIEMEY
jgi:WD40 repeat protein